MNRGTAMLGLAGPLCALAVLATTAGCRSAKVRGGEGPATIKIPTVVVPTDAASVARGQALFARKGCASCHSVGGGKLVGPDLAGVTARRTMPWLSRMILRPELMVRLDPLAQKLLAKYMAPMGNQHVEASQELPDLLAYLKSCE